MKAKYYVCIAILAFLGLLPQHHAGAKSSDEARLVAMQEEMDGDATVEHYEIHVSRIAQQFQIAPDTVRQLRSSGQGWGEITIELSMAQHLSKLDPQGFPTIEDALGRVRGLRADGLGWGQIAQDLGFKLGPVVSSIKSARDVTFGVPPTKRPIAKGAEPQVEGSVHIKVKHVREAKPGSNHHIRPLRVTRVKLTPVKHLRPHRPMRPGK
ncbi:MAG: hypothetical protein DRG76_11260 [Deltaproteobacteria bacterium]|nr:MAG: hypothetical protein DRG76_11260 [Deltaproteobacteria bacterium]